MNGEVDRDHTMSTPKKFQRNFRGPMLAMWALVQVGKRLGLGRAMARLTFRFVLARKLRHRAFAGYVPAAHDVFVATFAKSGTNWMMQIAQQIAFRGESEFDHIYDVVAWPETPGQVPVTLEDTTVRESSPTGLRVVKTHLSTEYVPYSEDARYLTVIRDPKEVLVSSYYFLGGLIGVLSHVTVDDWFELFMEPESLAEEWAIHTAGFWRWRDRPNVIVLSFGELKRQPRRSIERIAATMGVALDHRQLAKVLERASFDYMKAHESRFAPPSPPATGGRRTVTVRSGKTGKSGELLDRAQQAAVDQGCQEVLRRLGSDFPYAEIFSGS